MLRLVIPIEHRPIDFAVAARRTHEPSPTGPTLNPCALRARARFEYFPRNKLNALASRFTRAPRKFVPWYLGDLAIWRHARALSFEHRSGRHVSISCACATAHVGGACQCSLALASVPRHMHPSPQARTYLELIAGARGAGRGRFMAQKPTMDRWNSLTLLQWSRPLALSRLYPRHASRLSAVGPKHGAGFCSSFSMTSYKITSTLHTGVPLFNPPSSSALPARRAFTPSRPGVCSVQLSTPRFSPPTLTRQHAFGSSTLLLHPRPPELIPGWTLPAPLHTSSRLVPYTPRHATRRLYAVSGITRSSPQRRLAS